MLFNEESKLEFLRQDFENDKTKVLFCHTIRKHMEKIEVEAGKEIKDISVDELKPALKCLGFRSPLSIAVFGKIVCRYYDSVGISNETIEYLRVINKDTAIEILA